MTKLFVEQPGFTGSVNKAKNDQGGDKPKIKLLSPEFQLH